MIVSKGLALCAGPQARSARSGSLSPCGARQRAIQIRKSWRPGSSRWWAVSWRRRVELVGNARCAQHVPLSARADFCTWITRVVFSWIYLSPTQRQPRARTTAPTSGSSVRTTSAEAAPRLSSIFAALAGHSLRLFETRGTACADCRKPRGSALRLFVRWERGAGLQ